MGLGIPLEYFLIYAAFTKTWMYGLKWGKVNVDEDANNETYVSATVLST